jgi:hypothetical protein
MIFGNYEYLIEEGEVLIIRYNGNDSSLALIDEIDNKKITKIGNSAFSDCLTLNSIVFNDSLIYIGYSAFSGCINLEKVLFSKSLKIISGWAFSNCYKLRNSNDAFFPLSLSFIGSEAFKNCHNLSSVFINNSVVEIKNSAFKNCDSLTIYTKYNSRPFKWKIDWNIDNNTVIWGVDNLENCKHQNENPTKENL